MTSPVEQWCTFNSSAENDERWWRIRPGHKRDRESERVYWSLSVWKLYWTGLMLNSCRSLRHVYINVCTQINLCSWLVRTTSHDICHAEALFHFYYGEIKNWINSVTDKVPAPLRPATWLMFITINMWHVWSWTTYSGIVSQWVSVFVLHTSSSLLPQDHHHSLRMN